MYAPQDLRNHIGDRVHKDVSTSGTDDYVHVTRWIVQAARVLQRINDWPCHKQEFSLTLTAGTYEYAYTSTVWGGAALTRPRKIQLDSVRRVNSNRFLRPFDEMEEIDRRLGPQWKDSATANTSPEYVTEARNSLIVAGKPSQDFIDDTPTLEGYFYQGEDLDTTGSNWETTNFAFYDDFLMDHVDLAIIFGLQQEDESEFRTMLAEWNRTKLPELRGYDPSPQSNEQVHTPEWAAHVEGAGYIY